MKTKTVICIMGPTGTGKSQISLEVAKRIPSEIVSVDSAMVYRGMDIGTAKPNLSDRNSIPHHLIDIRDPLEPYSAGDFEREAASTIDIILAKGKVPILAGGTMLYFKALQDGLTSLPQANSAIRQHIACDAKALGWPALHERLKTVDPETALRIHPNDPQRLQRALEVYELTGRPLSGWHKSAEASRLQRFRFLNFVVTYGNRKEIHRRIAERFSKMLESGLIEEVQKLYSRGDLNPDLPSMRSVGYRQIWQYLSSTLDYETMKEKTIIATRQLAKRQLTWLRSLNNLTWFFLDNQTHTVVSDTILNTITASSIKKRGQDEQKLTQPS